MPSQDPKEHHDELQRLFAEAIGLGEAGRAELVARVADPGLHEELAALLAADAGRGSTAQDPLLGLLPAPAPGVSRGLPELPGYHIEDVLGVGGSSVVYRAIQERPNRAVALKVLRPELVSEAMLRRFRLEAEVLGYLRHPGIAQVYGTGTADVHGVACPWFAMELVHGVAVHEHCASNGLDLRERLVVFLELCAAVGHAHQRGVIHRDLKPGNVLVDDRGSIKVLDFGIARARGQGGDPGSLSTQVGQVIGTLAYMSPEQLGGDPGQIDARTDVYSLGVMLFELCAGKLPLEFGEAPLVEAVRLAREAPRPRLGQQAPACRGDLETIVSKAMEPEKERRYDAVSQLREDVERFLSNRPVLARPQTTLYQLKKLVRRHRYEVGIGLGALALLGVGAVVTARSYVRAAESEVLAAAREVELERERRQQVVAEATEALLPLGLLIQRDPVTLRDVGRTDALSPWGVRANNARVLAGVGCLPESGSVVASVRAIAELEVPETHRRVLDGLYAVGQCELWIRGVEGAASTPSGVALEPVLEALASLEWSEVRKRCWDAVVEEHRGRAGELAAEIDSMSAAEVSPEDAEFVGLLALGELGSEVARPWMDRALEGRVGGATLHSALATLAAEAEDWSGRRHHSWTAYALEPRSAWNSYNLGTALIDTWRREGGNNAELREEARGYLARAVEINPGLGPAWVNLGVAQPDMRKARAVLEEGFEQADIRIPAMYQNLGHAWLMLGDNERAADVLIEGFDRYPDETDLMFNVGVAQHYARRWTDSRRVFRRFLELLPDHWAAHHYLFEAELYLALQDPASASERLEELTRIAERSAELEDGKHTRHMLARAHLANGRADEALESFAQLEGLVEGPEREEWLAGLASIADTLLPEGSRASWRLAAQELTAAPPSSE